MAAGAGSGPPVVIGVWALLGAFAAAFIVRFRKDWREGVKAGVALVAASVALVSLVVSQAEQEPPEYFWDDSLKAGDFVVARGKLAADGVLDVVEDGITANNCSDAPPPRSCVP